MLRKVFGLFVLKVDSKSPDPKVVSLAVKVVKEGGIIVYPTDTVYGVGGNALDPGAVLRVFKVKERSLGQAVPVAVSSVKMAEELAIVNSRARKLMDRFWPGALTLILKRKSIVPLEVTGGREGVGLRMPNHKVPLAIMQGSGLPLVATSANKHGKQNPTTADEAVKQVGDEVDLVLDAGRSGMKISSTVIDLTRRTPVILRRGPIPQESIELVVGTVLVKS